MWHTKIGDIMEKRVIAVFLTFCLAMGSLCLRLYTLTTDFEYANYTSSHYKKVLLDTLRLSIVDCNSEPIVNRSCENFVVAKPGEKSVSLLYEALSLEEFDDIATSLLRGSTGYVSVGERFFEQNTNFITLKKFVRYGENPLAVHLIGYVNSDGNGVSGIERCFNSFLKTDVYLSADFLCDANGDFVQGAEIKTDPLYNYNTGGVKLTLDKKIQSVVQEELRASAIRKGTVVVCDVKTGEIRAMASAPEYDPDKVSDYLKDEDSPLTNRALSAFSVGSIFKVVVAACALESGISENYSYKCDGSIDVDGNTFHCNNAVAHGSVNMETALTQSCNCYFIDLAGEIKVRDLLGMAGNFGFGNSIEIAKGLFSSKGELPCAEDLKKSGNLANFSFGQGRFTATPMQMINVFNAIANGGKYISPYCVDNVKDVNGNVVYSFLPGAPTVALSAEAAEKITRMLVGVVENGTAQKARTSDFQSAGKTATAQTGIYNEKGEEQLCTWFAGFFPADSPRYSVVVLSEEGTTGGEDCAPVFKAIAQRIYELKVFEKNKKIT